MGGWGNEEEMEMEMLRVSIYLVPTTISFTRSLISLEAELALQPSVPGFTNHDVMIDHRWVDGKKYLFLLLPPPSFFPYFISSLVSPRGGYVCMFVCTCAVFQSASASEMSAASMPEREGDTRDVLLCSSINRDIGDTYSPCGHSDGRDLSTSVGA